MILEYKEGPLFYLSMSPREENPERSPRIDQEDVMGYMVDVWRGILDQIKAQLKKIFVPVDPISEKLLINIQGQIQQNIDRLIRVETDTDIHSLRNALSALDYMSLPSVVRDILALALNHPVLIENAQIKIIPATGEWIWKEHESDEPFPIHYLFQDALDAIPMQKLRMLQGKIWSLVVGARIQGAEAEVIHLMGFLADQIEHSISEKIDAYDRHDIRSTNAHSQLMTLSERGQVGHIVAPNVASISMIAEVATDEENLQLQRDLQKGFNTHWEERLKLDRNEFWRVNIPAPRNLAEKLADQAIEIILPAEIAPTDLLADERYYAWALARSAHDDRETLLQVIQQYSLRPLLEITSSLLGSFQGICGDIQFMTIPDQTSGKKLLTEKEEETAFINRVLLGAMPFRKYCWYANGEEDAADRGQGIGKSELWWAFGQIRKAFSVAESLEEVLEELLPAIDQKFLLKKDDSTENQYILKKRFELWGAATEAYFERIGKSEVGLMMETFFYSLANESEARWKELDLFKLLKNSFELEMNEEELEKSLIEIPQGVKNITTLPSRLMKNRPEILNQRNPFLNAWMKNEARTRLSLLEHVVKRRLKSSNGQVVMDAIGTLPFSPVPESFGFPVIRNKAVFWVYFPEEVESSL